LGRKLPFDLPEDDSLIRVFADTEIRSAQGLESTRRSRSRFDARMTAIERKAAFAHEVIIVRRGNWFVWSAFSGVSGSEKNLLT
jgi:hypothetical protein